MDRISKRLIKPESTLIEQTALRLATEFYEIGRSQGLKSKYKTHKAYAKRHLMEFIPKAVELLMEILANPATPENMRLAIYDAFLERANDPDLSNSIPVFNNPFAKDFVSDKVIPQTPITVNSHSSAKNRLEDLPLKQMLHPKGHYNG